MCECVRRFVCLSLCGVLLAAGCAGRAASPVPIHLPGDEDRPTAAIEAEIQRIDWEISEKARTQQDTLAANIVLGVGGFFVIVPWFFMNLKDAEGTEIEALKQRKTALRVILAGRAADSRPQAAARARW
jgi:hypothetical protein